MEGFAERSEITSGASAWRARKTEDVSSGLGQSGGWRKDIRHDSLLRQVDMSVGGGGSSGLNNAEGQ